MESSERRSPSSQGKMAGCAVLLLAVAVCMLGCAGPHRSPGAMQFAEPALPPPPPLPPVPWREDTASTLASGSAQWTDASRDRTITGRWVAPAGGGRALVLVLPGLAQGSQMPTALAETLAHAGFAVLALGHPGNDETVWQGQEARRADFQLAARRVYATSEAAERVADVHFVLAALEREPPPWLPQSSARLGVVGIGPGAQTAQWLVGERMTRDPPQAPDRRIAAVALVGPYVGFEGPAMSQRYGSVTTPLLLAYGLTETDPYGLGMTGQQRRAMVNQLVNARVVELRLSASTVAALQLPGMPQIPDGAAGSRMPPNTSTQHEPSNRSGRGPATGAMGATGAPPDAMTNAPPASASVVRSAQAARVALLFSISAFMEAELLGTADARDWLEGPHPGPVQWSVLPAGRAAAAAPTAPLSAGTR
jgi:hypothetical protein